MIRCWWGWGHRGEQCIMGDIPGPFRRLWLGECVVLVTMRSTIPAVPLTRSSSFQATAFSYLNSFCRIVIGWLTITCFFYHSYFFHPTNHVGDRVIMFITLQPPKPNNPPSDLHLFIQPSLSLSVSLSLSLLHLFIIQTCWLVSVMAYQLKLRFLDVLYVSILYIIYKLLSVNTHI